MVPLVGSLGVRSTGLGRRGRGRTRCRERLRVRRPCGWSAGSILGGRSYWPGTPRIPSGPPTRRNAAASAAWCHRRADARCRRRTRHKIGRPPRPVAANAGARGRTTRCRRDAFVEAGGAAMVRDRALRRVVGHHGYVIGGADVTSGNFVLWTTHHVTVVPDRITLTGSQRRALTRLVRARRTEQRLVTRAQNVLAAAQRQ